MATSIYFNNFGSSAEQGLIEDLVMESIKIYGHDVYYITRTIGAEDDILNEDDLPTFDSAIFVDMYIRSNTGFEGEGDLMSRFGVEIRDEMVLTVSKRNYEQEVTPYNNKNLPQAGDLIYLPLNNKIFEIMHVEHETVFYQMGSLQMYDMRCELMEFSNQRFNTGIPEIDDLYTAIDTTSNTSIEYLESVDVLADNLSIETEADTIIDFSEADPFSEGGNY